jgi:cell wall-associated NlpC family hydrolase
MVLGTAGVTLALVPGLLGSSAAHAAIPADAPVSIPARPVLVEQLLQSTAVYSSAPTEADEAGNATVSALVVAGDEPVDTGTVAVQVNDGSGWQTAGMLFAGADGQGELSIAVANPEQVRLYFASTGARLASYSREWTVQPNAARRSEIAAQQAAAAAQAAAQAKAAQAAAAQAAAQQAAQAKAVKAAQAAKAQQAAAARASRSAARTPAVVPAAASGRAAAVLAKAATFYGTPYSFGSSGPGSFDCSGFTSYVYRQFGVNLPHSSGGQERATTPIPLSAAQPGDLIFTWTGGTVTHVGIYMGGNMMYAATKTGDIVRPQAFFGGKMTAGRIG